MKFLKYWFGLSVVLVGCGGGGDDGLAPVVQAAPSAQGYSTVVTPSYRYDGSYVCTDGNEFRIASNTIEFYAFNPRTFDANTGAIQITKGGGRDNGPHERYAGTVSIDSFQKATITGTHFSTRGEYYNVTYPERIIGPWSCYRK